MAQSEVVPESLRTSLAVWTTSTFAVLALCRYLFGRFDWQAFQVNACSRCHYALKLSESLASVFDAGTGATFFFLFTLPLLSAAKGEGYAPVAVSICALITLAAILSMTGLGWLITSIGSNRSLSAQPDASFLTGLRVSAFVLSVLLLIDGNCLDRLFGRDLGERLIEVIGFSPIHGAAIVLISCLSISCGLRWAVPFVVGSRPLALAMGRRQGKIPN